MPLDLTLQRVSEAQAHEALARCRREQRPLVVFDRVAGVRTDQLFGLSEVDKASVDSVLVLDLGDPERSIGLGSARADTQVSDLAFLHHALGTWVGRDPQAPAPALELADHDATAIQILAELFFGDQEKPKVLQPQCLREWRAELRDLGLDMRAPVEDPWFRETLLCGGGAPLDVFGQRLVFVPLPLPAMPDTVATKVLSLTLARVLQARTCGSEEGTGPVTVILRSPTAHHGLLERAARAATQAPWAEGSVRVLSCPAVEDRPPTELSTALVQLSRLKYGKDRALVASEVSMALPKAHRRSVDDDPLKALIYRHHRSFGPLEDETAQDLAAARLVLGMSSPLLTLPLDPE